MQLLAMDVRMIFTTLKKVIGILAAEYFIIAKTLLFSSTFLSEPESDSDSEYANSIHLHQCNGLQPFFFVEPSVTN